MAGSPEVLEVRLRGRVPGLRKLLTGVIMAVTSVLFIVGGAAHPTEFGGILFILLGAAGLALCVAGALVFAGQATGRRPVLELDDQGVRVPAVWPRSRRADRLLPWSELAAVCAWSQGPPSGGRRDTLFPQRLAFLPADGQSASRQDAGGQAVNGQDAGGQAVSGQDAGGQAVSGHAAGGQDAGGPDGAVQRRTRPGDGGERRTPPENGAELLAIKVADVACVPTLRWSVLIRPGWDTTVEEIAKAVQRHRDDVPFIDRRDRPQLRRKRRPTTGKPSPGKPVGGRSAPEKSGSGRPAAGKSATGKASTGKPGTGKATTGRRSMGKPSSGEPAAGRPSDGESAVGKPPTGESPSGTSGTGKPAVGKPANEKPSDGGPGTGRPGTGGPAAPNEP